VPSITTRPLSDEEEEEGGEDGESEILWSRDQEGSSGSELEEEEGEEEEEERGEGERESIGAEGAPSRRLANGGAMGGLVSPEDEAAGEEADKIGEPRPRVYSLLGTGASAGTPNRRRLSTVNPATRPSANRQRRCVPPRKPQAAQGAGTH